MQVNVSPKTVGTSLVLAGATAALTQSASVALTTPSGAVLIPAEALKIIGPLVMLVVPFLLQMFAPGLLPLWEKLKNLLPMPKEFAEYRRITQAKEINPNCPVFHRTLRNQVLATFDAHHPPPVSTTSAVLGPDGEPVTMPVKEGGGI